MARNGKVKHAPAEADLLDEVASWFNQPPIEPDEFTVYDVVKRTGRLRSTIASGLRKKLELGQVTCREVYDPTRRRNVTAWRVVRNGNDEIPA